MLHGNESKTISLSLEEDDFQNDYSTGIEVLEAKDVLQPNFLERPKTVQWSMVSVDWLLVCIATYFRLIVYEYLIQQYKKKELTTVNKLNLVVILIQHLSRTSGVLVGTLLVLNGDSLKHAVGGDWLCFVYFHYVQFAFFYSFVGSLGISIYRILLIKQNYLLKNVIGENVMRNLILYGGILLVTVFTILLNYHDYAKMFDDTCMIIPNLQVLLIFDEYEQSRGNSSIMLPYLKLIIVNCVILAIMTMSEILIYVIFFYHMYKHDNSDSLRRILEPKMIRSRNRKNAITFFGQFCSFVLELIGLLLIGLGNTIGTHSNNLPLVAIAFRRVSFPIISMVEVITSDVLRSRILKTYLYNKLFRTR